jgi:hypothetical protein
MMADVVRVVLASLLLFGCGRVGFGSLDDADAALDAYEPLDPVELTLPAPFSTASTTFVDVSGASGSGVGNVDHLASELMLLGLR